jgi:RNA polymerase sigma-70 factor (ECF subfamily)
MYRLAKSITGCPQDAQDVVHNVFSRIVRRDFTTAFLKNPKGYLYQSAVNGALRMVKTRGRQTFTEDDVEYLPDGSVAEPDDDTPRRLREAMAQLSPEVLQMLVMRYEQNLSDADIARLLGKSRGTVAVTMFRARARIKKLMRNSEKEKHHETR